MLLRETLHLVKRECVQTFLPDFISKSPIGEPLKIKGKNIIEDNTKIYVIF